MNFNQKSYVEEVLKLIMAPKKVKNRIKEDLHQRIDEAMDDDVYYNVYECMGEPSELAEEFNRNLESNYNYYETNKSFIRGLKKYEYKSEKTLFGHPLVHINVGGQYVNKTAKGIVAIGDISFGVIAIGGVSSGVIAIGGVGVGLFSLGGIAIGGASLGAVSIGVIAFGAVAVGLYSFGAVAIGLVKDIGVLTHLLK